MPWAELGVKRSRVQISPARRRSEAQFLDRKAVLFAEHCQACIAKAGLVLTVLVREDMGTGW